MQPISPDQIVYTNVARCRDCYRCVRVCPVKAIRIDHGQASVDAVRCIHCGTCVRECPQHAKTFRRDLDKAQELVAGCRFTAVSLAPSFAGIFEPWQYTRLPSALRRLGFSYAAETAVGAYGVAEATARAVRSAAATRICTACPAVVSYIEKYEPARVRDLVPVVSPMIAHARHIKKKFGSDAGVIFIGPCVAKKAEAARPEFKGVVDCVLTFDELDEWMKQKGIDLALCEESSFDEEPAGKSRLFPVEGGCMAAGAMTTSVVDDQQVFVSGFQEMKDVLDAAGHGMAPRVVEPLLCPHGCVNGPGITEKGNLVERRARIIRYAADRPGREPDVGPEIDLTAGFLAQPLQVCFASDQQVRAVLEKASKSRPEDQLDCGACGYASCRDQAAAVVEGMADIEMCIPYMRRLAEQRSDRIIETSPNGIVVLDEQMHMLNFNPAFLKMFGLGEGCRGRHIAHVMDPELFERVRSGQTAMGDEVRFDQVRAMSVRAIVYALRAERQYVGIFMNITASRLNAERLQKVKDEAALQARELHEHQIEMARQFASFMGEYTAKGEQIVQRLMRAVESKDVAEDKKG